MFDMFDEGWEMGYMWHVTYVREVRIAHKVGEGGGVKGGDYF
jgi:hypothetical protein